MKNINKVESLLDYDLNTINKCEVCGVNNDMSCVKCYLKENNIDLRQLCNDKNLIEDKNLDNWSDDELLELIEIDIRQKYKGYLGDIELD